MKKINKAEGDYLKQVEAFFWQDTCYLRTIEGESQCKKTQIKSSLSLSALKKENNARELTVSHSIPDTKKSVSTCFDVQKDHITYNSDESNNYMQTAFYFIQFSQLMETKSFYIFVNPKLKQYARSNELKLICGFFRDIEKEKEQAQVAPIKDLAMVVRPFLGYTPES